MVLKPYPSEAFVNFLNNIDPAILESASSNRVHLLIFTIQSGLINYIGKYTLPVETTLWKFEGLTINLNVKTAHNLILNGFDVVGIQIYGQYNYTATINSIFQIKVVEGTTVNGLINEYHPINQHYRFPNSLFPNVEYIASTHYGGNSGKLDVRY
jgi:hypothetical protein